VASSVGQRISQRVVPWVFHLMGLGKLGEIRTEGLEHVPPTGPVVLVARHYHHLFDPVGFLRVFPRELHGLVTLDWARTPRQRRWMERATHYARFPVVLRKEMLVPGPDGTCLNPESAFRADEIPAYLASCLRDSVELLCEGRALGIFPEGYPNVDPHYTLKTRPDEFLRFRGGFARIAEVAAAQLGRPVPIVPAGTAFVPGRRWTATFRFGAPIEAPHPAGTGALVAAVEEAVKKLSGPDPTAEEIARFSPGA
jgi:putative membrane protein